MRRFDDEWGGDFGDDSDDVSWNGQHSEQRWRFPRPDPAAGRARPRRNSHIDLGELVINMAIRSMRLEKRAMRSARLIKALLEIEAIAEDGGPDALEKILRTVRDQIDRGRRDSKN